ncbi:MAG: NADP-dependent malic enzyme [Nitrospirae bacterium]|nr:MAG: NADP-dependent malic enzyme [Nitrospirota bacterium]
MPDDQLQSRKRHRGVIGIESKVPIRDRSVLSLVYTPGVAEPCLAIHKDPVTSFEYTCRGNTIAVVTDGSKVLSLGNRGPHAALPIMEGNAVLFKTFAGVDAFPICLDTQDTDEIVRTVSLLAPTFGAICLEDIAAPRCFTVEERLERATDIPVFHTDQHAAAIEVLAALMNAGKLVGKALPIMRVVINGAGAAGIATARLLLKVGVKDVVLCDRAGAIYKYRPTRMNWVKAEMALCTNREGRQGALPTVLAGADVFVGFSSGGALSGEAIAGMARDAIVLALALPEPEIRPELAKRNGAAIVATGRADLPNGVNTAMVVPGVFRGLLDVAARGVNDEMKIAAAEALAGCLPEGELRTDRILPSLMDFRVAPAIAAAVAKAAIKTGRARKQVDPEHIRERTLRYVYEGRFPIPPDRSGRSATVAQQSLDLHARYGGILEIKPKIPVKDLTVLSSFYVSPGPAQPAEEISKDPLKVYDYTAKGNLVAVVTDGSAVLGLGDLGPRAALPVMEGKAVLFHFYAGIEAFPICLGTQDPDEIITAIKHLAPTFGGINLEDIAAPRCFEIERRLRAVLDIPVFHDDQHGTAVVVLAGILNAMRLLRRRLEDAKIVICGAGAAGTAIARLLLRRGARDMILTDVHGIVYEGREAGMNPTLAELAAQTNQGRLTGQLDDALPGRDVFIGVSAGGVLKPELLKKMAPEPVIFALANPVPEIMPKEALAAGARIVATGRSDFPNQINNSLVFPGLFRGALDVRATTITFEMEQAAAQALADVIPEGDLRPDYIIPDAFDFRVPPAVAAAVAKSAMETGVARIQRDPDAIARDTRAFLYEGELGS